MKSIRFLISIVAVYVIVTLPSCKGKEDPGPEVTESQRVTTLMIGTWVLKSVAVDNVSKDLYKDLTITFTATGFTATNGSPIWPTSGTWAFTDSTGKTFKRDDQTNVTVDVASETGLTLSMDWSKGTVGPGRAQSVAGKHVFVFGK